MRQLLRRAIAVLASLSVVFSMLGVVHVPCIAMGGTSAAPEAHEAHGPHATHGTHVASGDAPAAPAGHDDGMATCLLVAHCGVTMLAASVDLALVGAPTAARRLPTDDTGPRAPALEPDSPPPRG